MTVELKAANQIDWVRPPRCPEGLEPEKVYAGTATDALPGLEVAVARWTKPGEPTRQALARLHGLRVNERTTPVVLAIETTADTIILFGPNTDVAPSKPVPREQALRNLGVALEASDQLSARDQLAKFLLSLDSASIPGLTNSGLFATHELREGVPNRADWKEACQASTALLGESDHELITKLGFHVTNAGPYALILEDSGAKPEAIAVMLEEAESFDADSHRFSISPIAYGLKMAEQQRVPWLILTKGHRIRLYPARIDLGVGRKGLAETFFELDLPHLTDENAGYLSLIFSPGALAEGGSTFEIMAASAQYGVALGSRLRNRVYEEIVPVLSVAVARQLSELHYEMDAEGLDLAYQLTLRIFFRMLFQTYAEDRKLLPFGENQRYDRNALKTLARDFTEEPDQVFDAESTSFWDDLTQVWHVIDKGDRAWGVPAYNGGLFSTDEDLHPYGAIIDRLHITNDVIGPCLKALLLDRSDDGEYGPVDFRSLSVREFGTIYEGLLESSLGLAEVDLTLDNKDTWVPAKKGDRVEAKAGEVYFHNTSGQRKGTGSYYTPTFVVEHLLERSLDPALDEHLEKVAAHLAKGDQGAAAELFFDFRVADLAMGSGHFLTAAIDHIEAKMAAFLEEDGHSIPGVTMELIALETAAIDAVGPDTVKPERSSLLRRQIARRCIYGLDINPISVELAKVSIWIHTFVRGLPMSSLDHNLVCANSLTGIGSIDEALDVLVPNRHGAATLFDAPITDALSSAKTVLADVALLPEVDRNETRQASRAVKKALVEAEQAKLLFDATVLLRIGRNDLVSGLDVKSLCAQAGSEEAQEIVGRLQSGHLPVLFPEVFLRPLAGFDVLIGNPPWEKLHVEEHQWWALRFPGLRGMTQKAKNERLAQLKAERPDLAAEHDEDVQAATQARKIIAAGPFPGIGEAHVDLFTAFAWRNWHAVAEGGRVGLVLPRNALSGASCNDLRAAVLENGSIDDACQVVNRGGWVFSEVHPAYTIAFVVLLKGGEQHRIRMTGPFESMVEFLAGRDQVLDVDAERFRLWGSKLAIPLLSDQISLDIYQQMMESPRFRDSLGRDLIPMQGDVNSTTHKQYFDFDLDAPKRDTAVCAGASFYTFNPDHGQPYAYASRDSLGELLVEKAHRQANRAKSAFHGWNVRDLDDLPFGRARLTYRRTTRATDTRTSIAALMPPHVFLTEQAPYFVTTPGNEAQESFLLGILNSRVFDWIVRRQVELNLSFELLADLPVPTFENGSLVDRVVTTAGRLAARDDRFADWAKAVGVPVGSVKTDSEQADMEAELDALVAHLYGLNRKQVQHIFKTFHRGWDYQPRLDAVLEHFDAIAVPA